MKIQLNDSFLGMTEVPVEEIKSLRKANSVIYLDKGDGSEPERMHSIVCYFSVDGEDHACFEDFEKEEDADKKLSYLLDTIAKKGD